MGRLSLERFPADAVDAAPAVHWLGDGRLSSERFATDANDAPWPRALLLRKSPKPLKPERRT